MQNCVLILAPTGRDAELTQDVLKAGGIDAKVCRTIEELQTELAKGAGAVLLEPIMATEVIVPEAFMGNVIGDLSSRRGKILGMEPRAGAQVVTAHVPLAEMFGYSTSLRSATEGRAIYTMQFHHYAPVPGHIGDQLIAKSRGLA